MSAMQADSFAVLRHIEVHGPRTRAEVTKGLAAHRLSDATKTINNLVAHGYLVKDATTKPINYALTGKARQKLAAPDVRVQEVLRAHGRRRPATPLETIRAEGRARMAALQRRLQQAHMAAPYSAREYQPSNRPGAMDAFALPSRMGDTLHYRDGRVTDMAGNPVD
jgi:hypothetical protein